MATNGKNAKTLAVKAENGLVLCNANNVALWRSNDDVDARKKIDGIFTEYSEFF